MPRVPEQKCRNTKALESSSSLSTVDGRVVSPPVVRVFNKRQTNRVSGTAFYYLTLGIAEADNPTKDNVCRRVSVGGWNIL